VLDTGESSIISMFWIPAFAGMTMLTAFDDYDTVSGGGHEGCASRFIRRSCWACRIPRTETHERLRQGTAFSNLLIL